MKSTKNYLYNRYLEKMGKAVEKVVDVKADIIEMKTHRCLLELEITIKRCFIQLC